RNDELRPITFRSGTFVSTAINSSESPSEKYSFAGSPLVFTRGNTATDLWETVAAVSVGRGVARPAVYRPRKNRPSDRAAAIRMIRRQGPPGERSPAASADSVRLIPSGVSSNAQATISATGKPSAVTRITSRIAQFGISRNGNTCVAT